MSLYQFLSPHLKMDGNDGPWSSFALQIGTPPQNVKVLISTASIQTLVVLPQGCTTSDTSNCSSLRGGLFLPNTSSTWTPNTATNSSLYALDLETALGYTGNGLYGFDTLTLGWEGAGGPTLLNQTVGGIATKEFYLGVFGLNPRPSNFSNFDNPIPSFMRNLVSQGKIPSLSWGYTAGNGYRLQGVLGSLTLGGYDASRFIANNITFPFNSRDIRDLSVTITSITTSSTMTPSNSSLSPTNYTTLFSSQTSPIAALIDSTIPYIYLPPSICTAFETAFNLTWNNETSLYLLDEYQQAALVALNASVTFTLSGAEGDVEIELPFKAFDLIVEYPIIESPTYYFPLRRAETADQIVLGRTFLQEAYLTADYTRRTFTVSQCDWDPVTIANQKLIAIYPLQSTASHPTLRHLLLILLPTILVTLLLLALILYFLKIVARRRRNTAGNQHLQQNQDQKKMDTEFETILKPELDVGVSRYELHDVNSEVRYAEMEGGRGGQYIYELGSRIKPVEADGSSSCHEMPANEYVGAELHHAF